MLMYRRDKATEAATEGRKEVYFMKNGRSILKHLGIVCLLVAVGTGAFSLLLSRQVSAPTVRSRGSLLTGVVKEKVVRTSVFKGNTWNTWNSYFLRVNISGERESKLMPVPYKAYQNIVVGDNIKVWFTDKTYYVDEHGSLDGLDIWPFMSVCLLAGSLSFGLFFVRSQIGRSRAAGLRARRV